MQKARIFVVDDHALLRAGIKTLLGPMACCEVVGEAESGEAALELLRANPPDVLLLDLNLKGGMSGLDVLVQAKRELPELRVVILSVHREEEYVDRALRAGASGYLVKDASMAEVELAINTVLRGDVYLSPSISRQILDGYMRARMPVDDELTSRQREIVALIATGLGTKEIAHQLGISPKTVETHRSQIMERLGISDIPSLVRYAIRTGLTKLDP